MSQALDAVLFDLDGTLIDSIELIRRSYVHTLEAHGLPAVDDAFWLAGLGRPLAWQFAQLAGDTGDSVDAMIATYRAYNVAHHDALVRTYPGAVEAVAALHARGMRLGIVTSKARASAERGLSHCGFQTAWFETLVSADDVTEHKPHPAPVLRALRELDARAERTVMVGDSPHDLASGRAAGTRTAAVAWGPFPHATLRATRPDYWLDGPADIADLG